MGNIDYSSVAMDTVPNGLGMAVGGFFIFNMLLGLVLIVVGILLIVRMFRAMKHIEEIKMMMERIEKKSMPAMEKKPMVMEKKMPVAMVKKPMKSTKPKK